jgi:hypothetical protein
VTGPTTVVATDPMPDPPSWARLQRQLFEALDAAWRRFEDLYCAPDGSLVYAGRTFGRDGVDDFYEPFFNWPLLYLLGGADDLLATCKRHWEGVTSQLTERGLLTDEYENGYDWFHQGESLLFFYGICAADPDDETFRERALRFAGLFLPDSPAANYDADRAMMRAPHIGALGPRPGLGDQEPYSSTNEPMRRYGLPLRDLAGIETWDDLADRALAVRMTEEMNRRLGAGDVPINLAVTSLLTNAWLYDHDPRFADVATSYVAAWSDRASANGGLIPDNVGPGGTVGQLHEGRWYGGHYGWTWPHGMYSVVAAALIGAVNATVIARDPTPLSTPRRALSTLLDHARAGRLDPDSATFHEHWQDRLSDGVGDALLLVPYRRDEHGWFDFQPIPPAFPTWLWWIGRGAEDRERLDELARHSGYDWRTVRAFREKEEGGHEPPWLEFLSGRNPDYPEQALAMALRQVERQRALMEQHPTPPPGDDIHWWQRLNPVVTEILTELVAGAPQVLYNGGLPYHLLRWSDVNRGRPGLPPGIAALVESIDDDGVRVQVVNVDAGEERVVGLVTGGYGEHELLSVRRIGLADSANRSSDAPVDETAVDGPLVLRLPPRTAIRLELKIAHLARRARHQRQTTLATTTGAPSS